MAQTPPTAPSVEDVRAYAETVPEVTVDGFAAASGASSTDALYAILHAANQRVLIGVNLDAAWRLNPYLADDTKRVFRGARGIAGALLLLLAATSSAIAAALPPPTGYAATDLIFEDTFSSRSLDLARWNPWLGDDLWGRWGNAHGHALPSPYSGPNCDLSGPAYQINDPYPAGHDQNTTGDHLVTGNGLSITAAPSDHWVPYCGNYRWPTAAITSYGKTYIPAEGGYFQARARMPDSSRGGWFGLWFMSANCAEIDLQESGYRLGSTPVNNVIASNYHEAGATQILHNAGVDLSADFHTYGMEFRPGERITMYLDGKQVAQYSNNVCRNAALQMLIDLEIANGNAGGWHSTASGGAFTGQVSAVQIYGLPKSPPPSALTAPSVPSNLAATVTGSRVDLTWTASTGPSGVYGYDVYRDGGWLGFSDRPSYADKTVSTGRAYTYTVMAYAKKGTDTAGSRFSEPLTVAVLGVGSNVSVTEAQTCSIPAGAVGTVAAGPDNDRWRIEFPHCTWVSSSAIAPASTRRRHRE